MIFILRGGKRICKKGGDRYKNKISLFLFRGTHQK